MFVCLFDEINLIGKSIENLMNLFCSIDSILAHLADCPEELLSERYIKFDDVHVISAKNEEGIDAVKTSIRNVLDKHAELKLEEQQQHHSQPHQQHGSN